MKLVSAANLLETLTGTGFSARRPEAADFDSVVVRPLQALAVDAHYLGYNKAGDAMLNLAAALALLDPAAKALPRD